MAARSRQELLPVSIFLSSSFALFVGGIQILVVGCQIITGCRLSLVPHIPFMHLDGQFFDVIDIQVCDGLFSFALGQLCKSGNSNKEGCFTHTLLMLLREEFEEVADRD